MKILMVEIVITTLVIITTIMIIIIVVVVVVVAAAVSKNQRTDELATSPDERDELVIVQVPNSVASCRFQFVSQLNLPHQF